MAGWSRQPGQSGGPNTPAPNQDILDGLGRASDGSLTFEGQPVASSGGSVSLQEVRTYNLFDKSRYIAGSSHNPSTGVVSATGQETHRIDVKPGYNYTFNKGDAVASGYSFYDENEVYISGGSALQAKAPPNARYLYVRINNASEINKLMVFESSYRFSAANDYQPYKVNALSAALSPGTYRSKWNGKTWWVLGDSISTGYGEGEGVYNQYASKPYHYLIARERFIHVQNDAVSGYQIGQIYDNKVVNMPPTEYAPDLITIMAGTNDHGFQTSIGTIDDLTTAATFYGRYKKTIEFLQERFPFATIGLITPIQRNDTVDGNAVRGGATLRGFCDAVIALGKRYSIPVLDIYDNLGFTPYNAAHKAAFYVNGDGTHPNNAGHIRMAARVGDFIERI